MKKGDFRPPRKPSHDKWFANQQQIEEACGVTKDVVKHWIKDPTFPKRHANYNAYNKLKVLTWVQARNNRKIAHAEAKIEVKAAAANAVSTTETPVENLTLRERKTYLECKRLQVVIDREIEGLERDKLKTQHAKNQLIAVEDHVRLLEDVVGAMLGELDNFVSVVTAKVMQPDATTAAEQCVRHIRQQFMEALEAVD